MFQVATDSTAIQVERDSVGIADVVNLARDSLIAVLDRSTQAVDSLATTVSRLSNQLGTDSLWEIGSSLAAIVVAILAGIELWRLYRARRDKAERVAASVSAIAMPLRRSIASWLEEMPKVLVELNDREMRGEHWTQKDRDGTRAAWSYWNGRSARGHIAEAERRVEKLNAEAPLADEAVRSKVIRATAGFYGSFDLLNPIMAMSWGDNGITATPQPQLEDRTRLVQAYKKLRECHDELRGLIDQGFKIELKTQSD